MKIKRREYERLSDAARELGRLKNLHIIIRSREELNGTQVILREVLRKPLVEWALENTHNEYAGLREAQCMTGTFDIEVLSIIPGYESYIRQMFTPAAVRMSSYQTAELNSWPETTEDSSVDTPETVPASETVEEVLAALATRLSGEVPTSTESGKTETANKPNESEGKM